MTTIKGKLLRTFFLIIGVLSLTSFSLFYVHFVVVERYKAISDNMIAEYSLINTVSDLIASYNSRFRNINVNEGAENDKVATIRTDIINKMNFLDGHITDKASKASYLGLKNTITDVSKEVDLGLEELADGNVTGASTRYEIANKKYLFVKENGNKLVFSELSYAQSIQEQLDKLYRFSSVIGGLVLFLAVGGSILYAFRFSNKVASPIRKLAEVTEAVAEGNMQSTLNQELLDRTDEIGQLSRSYSVMLTKLINNISELDTSNKELKEISKTITSKNSELEKLNEYMINRELKMVELKKTLKEYEQTCAAIPKIKAS